jgi:hypothetical protein
MGARTSRRMSKMSSANSRAIAIKFSIALVMTCGATLPLAGCGVNVHSATVRGTGYVRLDEVVKHHPLYAQLTQLNDAIAAINLQAAAPQVPLSAGQIIQQTAELNRELRAAQQRANKILATKQQDYAGLGCAGRAADELRVDATGTAGGQGGQLRLHGVPAERDRAR